MPRAHVGRQRYTQRPRRYRPHGVNGHARREGDLVCDGGRGHIIGDPLIMDALIQSNWKETWTA